jgi:hypothetical protein
MSELTNDQLDDIERRLNEFDAMVSGNAVLADRKQLQEEVSIAEWRAVIGALRRVRTERGRVVAVTRHRDVTLTTYERANDDE